MNKLTIPVLLSAGILLSGCPERLVGPHANDFYAQSNNMLCVNHSKNVETGLITTLYTDETYKIPLNRISPKKSCAVFNVNDHITTTTTTTTTKATGNDEITLKPNLVYNFHTALIKKNGDSAKGSGFGPRVCFSQEGASPIVLEIENHSDRRNRDENSIFCPLDPNTGLAP